METKEVHGSQARIATKGYYSIFIPDTCSLGTLSVSNNKKMHTHENQANNFQSFNGKY